MNSVEFCFLTLFPSTDRKEKDKPSSCYRIREPGQYYENWSKKKKKKPTSIYFAFHIRPGPQDIQLVEK